MVVGLSVGTLQSKLKGIDQLFLAIEIMQQNQSNGCIKLLGQFAEILSRLFATSILPLRKLSAFAESVIELLCEED